VQADVDRILAQRGAGDAGATQVGQQYREIAAIGLPGGGGLLQGFEHARRRASGWRRRRGWAQLPIGHAGGDQQKQENGEHRAATTL